MKKGPFEVTSSNIIYKNPWMTVTEDRVIRPGGEKGLFGVIDLGAGGVNIVALNKKKEIYLIKEYYYAYEMYGTQTPAGGIDKGETPLEAAKRELLEETGCISERWVDLGYIQPFTMIIKSTAYLFLALDVEEVETERDALVKSFTIPFEKGYEMAMNNEIVLGGSILAILKAKIWLDHHVHT